MPPPPPSIDASGFSAQEAAGADKDYIYFLRHLRLDGDAYSLVIPPKDGASAPEIIRYEQLLPDHNAVTPVVGYECGGKNAPLQSEENSRATGEAPHGMKRKAPDASPSSEVRSRAVPMEEDTPTPVEETAWYDSPKIDNDLRYFLRYASLGKDKVVFKKGNCKIAIGGNRDAENGDTEAEGEEDDELDSVGTEEAFPASETEHVVDSDLPILKVKEEEESKEGEDDVGPRSDIQIVNEPVYYETVKMIDEVKEPLNALVSGATDLDPLDKREPSSSKGHLAIPLNASELQGVIWPPHINERPDSVFKEKLIEFLKKPFTQEEYDNYFSLATDHAPMEKERRTRNKVVNYKWTHEMSKSYFDRYPDLAEQFSLQSNNHPNGLALLRGLFFWLQNIGLEDQFRPWSDEFKNYRVVPFEK